MDKIKSGASQPAPERLKRASHVEVLAQALRWKEIERQAGAAYCRSPSSSRFTLDEPNA
jgi:hypothetical protein